MSALFKYDTLVFRSPHQGTCLLHHLRMCSTLTLRLALILCQKFLIALSTGKGTTASAPLKHVLISSSPRVFDFEPAVCPDLLTLLPC